MIWLAPCGPRQNNQLAMRDRFAFCLFLDSSYCDRKCRSLVQLFGGRGKCPRSPGNLGRIGIARRSFYFGAEQGVQIEQDRRDLCRDRDGMFAIRFRKFAMSKGAWSLGEYPLPMVR